jgi:hypothetical protein
VDDIAAVQGFSAVSARRLLLALGVELPPANVVPVPLPSPDVAEVSPAAVSPIESEPS